jgi:hypothetical protein
MYGFELGRATVAYEVDRKDPKKRSVRLYPRITSFEKMIKSNPGITAIEGFSVHEVTAIVARTPRSTKMHST